MNSDLILAKETLEKNNYTLCAVKSGKVIFTSRQRGILPLYMLTFESKIDVSGASLADKIIGNAAAVLCIKAGFKAVHAGVATFSAEIILNDIEFTCDKRVDFILNRTNTGPCPMEIIYRDSIDADDLKQRISVFYENIESENV